MRYPLTKIKENNICAEIGVWKGDNASQILTKNPQKLHLIDPWVHQDYDGRWYSIEQKKMDDIYNSVLNKFKNNNKVIIHKCFSTDIKFPKQYFNWVYIDGNHSYENVLKDLKYYYPLIKTGGYLCGDDYGWKDSTCNKGPKVPVDEFVSDLNINVEIKEGNQFVIPVIRKK